MRPIILSVKLVTYNNAKHLIRTSGPLLRKSPQHMPSSMDFCQLIPTFESDSSWKRCVPWCHVTFDMYTCIWGKTAARWVLHRKTHVSGVLQRHPLLLFSTQRRQKAEHSTSTRKQQHQATGCRCRWWCRCRWHLGQNPHWKLIESFTKHMSSMGRNIKFLWGSVKNNKLDFFPSSLRGGSKTIQICQESTSRLNS